MRRILLSGLRLTERQRNRGLPALREQRRRIDGSADQFIGPFSSYLL
jgi:hypothetical protein